jgi:hypothetical protein
MSPTTRPPPAPTSLHDELVFEASITLREALARLEARRQASAPDASAARHDTVELVATALELLHRAEDVQQGR